MKIHAHHGTNAVCGCWSKCVVVGVGSINSSVTEETRRDGHIRHHELKQLRMVMISECLENDNQMKSERRRSHGSCSHAAQVKEEDITI